MLALKNGRRDPKRINSFVNKNMFFGSFLILIGVVFLLKNLGLVSADAWGMIWPVFLIVWGAGFLLKRGHSSCWGWGCDWGHKDSRKDSSEK